MADNNLFYGKGITVASGFDLGAKSPLDHRLVVQTAEERDAHITGNRAYPGMLVYVKDDDKTYRFNGTVFVEFGVTDLSEYAKTADVEKKIADAVTSGTIDLTAYAKTADMNKALEGKVDKAEGKSLIADTEIARLAEVKNYDDTEVKGLIGGKADKNHKHSYNDLDDKPEIPSIEGLASKTYVDGKVSDLVNGAPEAMDTLQELAKAITDHQTVYDAYVQTVSNNLAKKVDIVEGKSLVADTEIAKIHEHANKEELDKIEVGDKAKWDSKADGDHNHDGIYLKEVPAEYITEEELAAEGFLKEHQSLVDYAKTADVDTKLAGKAPLEHTHSYNDLEDKPVIPDVSGFATKEDEDAREKFVTDVLTVNPLGGITAGTNLNGLTVKEILNKLLYPYVKPIVSAKGNPNGGIFEKGKNQVITNVQVSVTKKSEKITKIEVFDGANSLGVQEGDAVAGGGTYNFTVNIPVESVNKTLTAKVTDASNTVTSANTASFTFVYPYYTGIAAENAEINEEFIKGLTKKVEVRGNKTVAYTCNNEKMVFAYPKAYGVIKQIFDPNNFDVTGTFIRTEVSITGLDGTAQAYYVYTNGASTVDNFNMRFNY